MYMYVKGIKKIAMTMGLILLLSFLIVAHNSHAQDNSPDAIAIRIIPNPNHYSISRWYASQNFSGSPQALSVDGYEAIRDGRTVYVNAANVDQASRTIYTNIYLISYNQNSEQKTVDILGQVISHWKFNDNIIESNSPAPSCSISSLNCKSDSDCGSDQNCALAGPLAGSCVLKNIKNCHADSDCPANFFCDGLKAKITRDIKRVGRLEEIREALNNFKQANKRYPTLLAGTYLANNSLSVWPSWKQALLSDLAVSQSFIDPINKLGKCVTDDIVKNGIDYTNTNAACNLNSGVTTASCNNAYWDYSFSVNSNGDYKLWAETSNNNSGGIYGDLSSASALFPFADNFCSDSGIQHHLLFYVDGVLKGSACNPAVNPNQSRQTAYVDLGHLNTGSHTVRIKWDNDWNYNPDGIWGNSDDADSNLKIYRLGLTTASSFDLETCWDQTSRSFAYSSSTPSSDSSLGTLTLPPDSYAFGYATDPNGSRYNLCATLESRSPSLAYTFGPFDLADSACALATGVNVGGQSGNSAPLIVSQFLVGEAHQAFNGYIQAMDAEGDLLNWSILNSNSGAWSSWQSPAGQVQPPVLQNTSNPYQKKVYAPLAGDPGTYSLSLSINDGQGGVLNTTTPITIISPPIYLSAENVEYALDAGSSFSYVISFSSNSLNNPSTAYSVKKISDSSNNILAGLTKSFINLGDGKYQVKYEGTISTIVTSDTVFNYQVSVEDSYGKTVNKNFSITLKRVGSPNLDFSCADVIRVGEDYSCVLGPTTQGTSAINYSVSGLPAGLSQAKAVISGNTSTSSPGNYTVKVAAASSYGTASNKSFTLRVNNFCGDGMKQQPNTEGRGGPANNGQESCDGSSGITTSPAASSINLQYACDSNLCVYKSPVNGGGYCGDGYCQMLVNGQNVESFSNCAEDCGISSECVPSCVGRCAGASNGCLGTCPDTGQNSICDYNESRSCLSVLGVAYTGTAICKSDCSGFNTAGCNLCTPSCVGKCAHASDGCNGTCAVNYINNVCTIGATSSCAVLLGDTMRGTAYCKGDCSGFSTSTCCSDTCTGKCAGVNDGCGGTCEDVGTNSVCAIGDSSPCSSLLGAGYTGNALCKIDCTGYNTTTCTAPVVCTPACAGKCAGVSDGCGGTCAVTATNNICLPGVFATCSSLLGAGYTGSALCKTDCTGYNTTTCTVCTPACAGKCAGASNGCGGTCPATANNVFCTSSYEADCSAYLNWPPDSFSGSVVCNSSCSAYDTSLCDASGSYWYRIPTAEDSYLTVGTVCMVKMNFDANNNIECIESDEPNYTAQWVQGVIALDQKTKICSVLGCTTAVNTNKCRYLNGIWSNHCFVHKTW